MCYAGQRSGCQFANKLRRKPADCTVKEIKECHGSARKHPCIPKKNKKKSTSQRKENVSQISFLRFL